MKKLLCILLIVQLVLSLAACGKNPNNNSTHTVSSVTHSNTEDEAPKDTKNYTLLCIPKYYMDAEASGNAEPLESLCDNVTIDHHAQSISDYFDLSGDTWKNENANPHKTLTIAGKTYEYTYDISYENEWSVSQQPSALKYAYYDEYVCRASEQDIPVSYAKFNSATGKLSMFIRFDVDESPEGDIGEKAISEKADQFLREVFGKEYLENYAKSVSSYNHSYTTKTYYVVYQRDRGDYYCKDRVRLQISPKGELIGINAVSLDFFADYDFDANEETLLAAKEAMYSAIYADPMEWKDRKPILTVDGLTGNYYLYDTITDSNDEDSEWDIYLALN